MPSGVNSRPSMPGSANSGTNTSTMISVAKTMPSGPRGWRAATTSSAGSGCAAGAVLPQPAKDVLDVDDRVVDQLADRDRQAAQRHRVDRQPEPLEHQRRDDDRQRDRRQRDERRAEVQQEQEQHDHHQDRAVAQRLGDVADRGLDEVGLAEQHAAARLMPGGQALLQLGQRVLDLRA